ncbi:hypothetical protein [Nonomuraea sp. PA05]|uniref:hypothetical protein n=1 Tax=Nonomuraea sp. PA05 TaxID=2604466 RepID=UPI001652264B|nr:hypothetical protein [Nonomuraea sp. PA05]
MNSRTSYGIGHRPDLGGVGDVARLVHGPAERGPQPRPQGVALAEVDQRRLVHHGDLAVLDNLIAATEPT